MLTLKEVLDKLGDMGVDFAPRTFWKYVDMRLLPEGRKLPGRGNLFFFPEDTPERIAQLYTLNKDLGFPLHLLQRTMVYLLTDKPWNTTAVPKPPSGAEFVVWMAGFMANQNLLNKASLEPGNLALIHERLRGLFEAFGVGQSITQTEQNTHAPIVNEKTKGGD
jgi:hypothetical protein